MYIKSGSNCTTGRLAAGDVASVVINYPSLLLAAKKIDAFIAVAMEYAPPANNSAGERFAKFYVFAPDEATGEMVRITSANFDGRGEKSVPGVCTTCHGGRPAQSVVAGQPYPNDGNLGAIFMPWDVDSFLFSGPDGHAQKDPSLPPSTQPFLSRVDLEVLATYTRANQEDDLRRLNEAVLATYPRDAHVRTVVHDWYSAAPNYASNTLTGMFRSHYVPPGWSTAVSGNSVQPAELYRDVIAQHCRACHTQLVRAPTGQARVPGHTQDVPTFESYQSFVDEMTMNGVRTDRIIAPIFDTGVMPMARLTADRLWVPAPGGERPADLLAAHLGVLASRVPGRPSASIQSNLSTYARGNDVLLDGGTDSRFAETFSWNLQYAAGARCTTRGTPFVSTAQLVGQGTALPRFKIDVPGSYTVALDVASAEGRTFAADPLTIVVDNRCPQASDALAPAVPLGTSLPNFDLNNAGIVVAGDVQVASPHLIEWVADANVDVTIVNGVATITCGAGCVRSAPGVQSYFDFRVVDNDGDFDVGRVMVTVTDAPRPNANAVSVPNVPARTPTFGPNTPTDTLLVYSATSGGTGNRTISVPANTPQGGTASVLSDGRTVRYLPRVGFVGRDTFTYTVTDSNPASPQQAAASVTFEVDAQIDFDNEIFSGIFVTKSCALGCHNGAAPNPEAQGFFNLASSGQAGWNAAVTEIRQFTRDTVAPLLPNLLFWPNNAGHTGVGFATSWGTQASCGPSNDTSPFCALLRWQEEGACRVDASGQPIGACPPP
jgi:hypothetical protein